jgi:glycosyltransferase involved in cell wall biosynthesis
MNKPRSLFLFTDATAFGGAEAALLLLLEHLDRDLWRPTLVYHPSEAIEPLERRGAEAGAELLPVPPLPLGIGGAQRVPALARLLRRERPDVFHAHLSWQLACKFPLAAAVLARVPAVVATMHLYVDAPLTTPSLVQLRALGRGVGRYIAVSDHIAEELRRDLRLADGKVEAIHNAVDVSRFSAAPDRELRRTLTGDDVTPLVLTVARLHEQKGIDVLLEAVPKIPTAHFAIAGDGPERGRLEKLARDLGVEKRVRFLGPRSDIPALLLASDLFVLPSRYEGFPLALLEAMAAEVPVVATRIAGVDELVVDGQNGNLVEAGDSAGLGTAITNLLADPGRRKALATRGHELVLQRYGAEATAARVTHVYDELLSAARESDAKRRTD